MESKNNVVVCAVLCSLLALPNLFHCATIITKRDDVADSRSAAKSLKVNGSANTVESILGPGIPRTNVDGGKKINNDANKYRSTSLLSMPEIDYANKIETAASEYIYTSLYPMTGLVIPNELASTIKSPDELIALLNSPSLLTNLSTPEIHAVVTVLTSSPGLLTALPASAVANVISALSSSAGALAKLPRPTLYSLLTIFTVRPRLLGSLPTAVTAGFASGLFSLSPGALYNVPTPILANVLGTACSPHILSSLSDAQLTNFLTLLSLSEPLVKALPVAGFVSLLRFLGSRPAVLSELPPPTLFALLRALFATVADSSSYLLNDSTATAITGLLAAVLTPQVLNVLPLDAFRPLLAILWSSPSLLSALPPANVVSLLSAVALSPNLLVAVNASHLEGLLSAIASDSVLFEAVPPGLVVELMNSLVAYLPKFVDSMPKSTLSKLLGAHA